MKKITVILCLLLISTGYMSAQQYTRSENGATVNVKGMDIKIEFYTPSIVRILKTPAGHTVDKKSLSVIKEPEKTEISLTPSDNRLSLESKQIRVTVDRKTGTVTFYSKNGKKMFAEKRSSALFTDFNDAGNKTYSVHQSFVLDKDEAIYGLGEQQQGKMVQRNITLHMIQGNTDDYIPFFVSVKGYGMFWDNYSPTEFTDTPDSTSFTSDVGNCIDYYFMSGGTADGVIANMRDLTGQVPMFPLWTFGYFQSKERYKSQDELVDVVKKYRELGVPFDGIIQDWQYWGNNYLWNAMEFLNSEYYNPQKMVNDVHKLHAHMLISIWNSFGPQTKQYKELDKIGALMDFKTWPLSGSDKWPPMRDYPSGVRVYDPYNPAARDIYWKYLNKGIFSLGMDGWWLDSSEPDHMDFKPSDLDDKTYLGSFRKVRNAFPLMTVGGIYQHQRAVTSAKRVFILTRSAFAGQQRYGANTWSGDVVASWDALRAQISAGLNFSLSDIPYWNSDIGGFFLWNFKKPLENADYRELYARWIQFGAFCPMMRSHGTDAPREIYRFGKAGDPIYDAIDKFINLRYRLLPYIYTTAWNVTAHQSSMMRALMMDFPNDKQALDINDQYMFGRSLLVCPVTTPMYSKIVVTGRDTAKVGDFSTVKSEEVYLPKGTNWIDFWTGEKFNGGQTVQRETPIDIMPLFVKAGSILPIGPKVEYATEKNWDTLEIRIYPGADGTFSLYEDENDNYDYEKGMYSTIPFTWDDEKNVLIIGDRKGSFPGMIDDRTFNIVVVTQTNGDGMKAVKKFDTVVPYNGKKVVVTL